MSANSETMNYKLPVFLANDIPSWLTDWNGSMRKIDELIFNANSNISDLATKDTQIENTVNGLNSRVSAVENDLNPNGTGIAKDVSTLDTKVDNHTKQLKELDTVTTNLTTLCGDSTLQTNNKTLTGAVNELFETITPTKQTNFDLSTTAPKATSDEDFSDLDITFNFSTTSCRITFKFLNDRALDHKINGLAIQLTKGQYDAIRKINLNNKTLFGTLSGIKYSCAIVPYSVRANEYFLGVSFKNETRGNMVLVGDSNNYLTFTYNY